MSDVIAVAASKIIFQQQKREMASGIVIKSLKCTSGILGLELCGAEL